MSSLFCGKESGLKIPLPRCRESEFPPTPLKCFTLVLGILNSLPHIVFIILHLWYWCQIFLQKNLVVSLDVGFQPPLIPPYQGGRWSAQPNLHYALQFRWVSLRSTQPTYNYTQECISCQIFLKEILNLRVGWGSPSTSLQSAIPFLTPISIK